MPRVEIQVGGREHLKAAVLKGTPMGALGTEAVVHVGAVTIRGRAWAFRALADALVEAADMATEYDDDPDAWNEREQAERDLDY